MKKKIQTSGMISFIRQVALCMAVVLVMSIQSCQVEDEVQDDLQESVADEVYLKNASVTSAEIDAFIQLINNMVATNALESGIAKSLIAKLENVKKSLVKGDINTSTNMLQVNKAAMNLFNAFENQVNDLKATEKISEETGGILTSVITVFTGEWSCGQPFVDLRDGNIYNTVKIGDQCWMSENLSWLPLVSPSSEGSFTEPYYYVYDYQGTDIAAAKATDNYKTYGVLYNWPAAKSACPTGWHLPSDAEWTQLVNYLIANGYNYDGTTTYNKIAKAMAATTNWTLESAKGAIGNDLTLNNKSGFSALPGGQLNFNEGGFYVAGSIGYWWSCPETTTYSAWARSLAYSSPSCYSHQPGKANGFSVRCVKN